MSLAPPLPGGAGSLADTLRLALPHAGPALMTQQAREALLHWAAHLPDIPRGLIECRLSGPAAADLSLGLPPDADAQTDLAAALAALSDGGAGWETARAVADTWARHGGASSAWFEFDIAPDAASLPPPAIFLERAEATDAARDAAAERRLLDCLGPGTGAQVSDWDSRLPPGARLRFAGQMLSRPEPALRLNLTRLSADAALRWLGDHGAGPADAGRFARLFGIGRRTVLAVEAQGDGLGERIGVECKPGDHAGADALIDWVREAGLCRADSAAAALAWPGATARRDAPERWPLDLVLASLARGDGARPALLRQISHAKVTWSGGHPVEAKIYLSFAQAIFHPSSRDGRPDTDRADGAEPSRAL